MRAQTFVVASSLLFSFAFASESKSDARIPSIPADALEFINSPIISKDEEAQLREGSMKLLDESNDVMMKGFDVLKTMIESKLHYIKTQYAQQKNQQEIDSAEAIAIFQDFAYSKDITETQPKTLQLLNSSMSNVATELVNMYRIRYVAKIEHIYNIYPQSRATILGKLFSLEHARLSQELKNVQTICDEHSAKYKDLETRINHLRSNLDKSILAYQTVCIITKSNSDKAMMAEKEVVTTLDNLKQAREELKAFSREFRLRRSERLVLINQLEFTSSINPLK